MHISKVYKGQKVRATKLIESELPHECPGFEWFFDKGTELYVHDVTNDSVMLSPNKTMNDKSQHVRIYAPDSKKFDQIETIN